MNDEDGDLQTVLLPAQLETSGATSLKSAERYRLRLMVRQGDDGAGLKELGNFVGHG
ncbi:MAG: hypothetical protein H0X73_03550 [Chthoniobacterales bacterium]|nr:hypothetical protein [Chthoniobacterales bacterium]